jgi:hypothetical protein
MLEYASVVVIKSILNLDVALWRPPLLIYFLKFLHKVVVLLLEIEDGRMEIDQLLVMVLIQRFTC